MGFSTHHPGAALTTPRSHGSVRALLKAMAIHSTVKLTGTYRIHTAARTLDSRRRSDASSGRALAWTVSPIKIVKNPDGLMTP